MGDVLIRGGVIYVKEDDSFLIAKIDATAKLSNDKLEKISSILRNKEQISDAGLAPLAALCSYNPTKKIDLLQNDDYITLTMEL